MSGISSRNHQSDACRPLIVGIGGTVQSVSSTEQALEVALAASRDAGARTLIFGGELLAGLPHYGLPNSAQHPTAARLVAALREADGVIIASPGYHGGVSGLVKNAVDFTEEMAGDPRVYFDDMPVGLIATAYGWQAAGTTLSALRAIVHALRGWPTPFGAAINCSGGIFQEGHCTVAAFAEQLRTVGRQVAEAAIRAQEVPSVAEMIDA